MAPLPFIGPEQASDAAAIADLVTEAFRGAAHSDGTEAAIVAGLRQAGALTVSLVARDGEGQPIGHVAFSSVLIDGIDCGWFGLGPLAVLARHRRHGIGALLARTGLELLKDRGASGCVVLGDPAYYRRFGFRNQPALVLADVPPDYFMALALTPGAAAAQGMVSYHEAFYPA